MFFNDRELSIVEVMFGIRQDAFKSISISTMTAEEQLFSETHCKPKRCYDNAMKMTRTLIGYKYVLGYVQDIIPIAHAIVKTPDGRYVDPTLILVRENVLDLDYYIIYEGSYLETVSNAVTIGDFFHQYPTPPELDTLRALPEFQNVYLTKRAL
ncbi:hypothetical protein LRP52_29295 [Photobacterium sp. ZSDE20]|uniref:Uncharacterized protein n=1 Tax=Photobacterium pectinilyticum TaxID=2906793 RepID=A0ABT1N6B3_9GAMM|nr:hypothetical protein [Photobacterium sp. ZSDE20]MCQ1060289.1 hypothetical protein [Photobacterium sp. ZSDE20]MDD1826276.1 hypothetical protein [Photobacterium sp. ZSDE20]